MDSHATDSSFTRGYPGPRLPPTPELPSNPTILPHVKEHLPALPSDLVSQNEPKLPLTPPSLSDSDSDPATLLHSAGHQQKQQQNSPPSALLTGLNVLQHSAHALNALHHLYATSVPAQLTFQRTVSLLASTVRRRSNNRIIVCGVGKSAKIAQKFVVTLGSMRVRATFLHAAEAMHGDLGFIEEGDALVLVTFSGKTEELRTMMRHVGAGVRVVVLTGWRPDVPGQRCPLLEGRDGLGPVRCEDAFGGGYEEDRDVVLEAPIPVSEEVAFGIRAPTTSTTVALALCDSLALAVAGELHGGGKEVEKVFRICHPGGAIGKVTREEDGA